MSAHYHIVAEIALNRRLVKIYIYVVFFRGVEFIINFPFKGVVS